jgi:CheY-like chemotaxis protein
MDRATKNRIFEPFFTTKPQGEGTGLGLSVVYGIIVNHGGFIDVDTEPGHGTMFRLCLPIPPDAVSAVELEAQAAEKDGQELLGRGEVILFAEDEMRQLRLMENFLQSKGYRILPAKDGAEAVEVFCQHKDDIALVILDLGLPKLNGWEALRKIREVDPSVKAIFATGFMAPQIESQLAAGSVSAVIMKPYQLDEVLQSICGAIKKPAAENAIAASPAYEPAPLTLPAKSLS